MGAPYHYLIGRIPNSLRTFYIKCHESRLEVVTDLLFDYSCTVLRLDVDEFVKQLIDGHPEHNPYGEVWIVEEGEDDIDIE